MLIAFKFTHTFEIKQDYGLFSNAIIVLFYSPPIVTWSVSVSQSRGTRFNILSKRATLVTNAASSN